MIGGNDHAEPNRGDTLTLQTPSSGWASTGKPVPVMSARTLIPFIDFLGDLGAPVERWLERCRLPSRLCEDPNAYISTLKHWEFVSLAANEEGIDDLGLMVAHDQGYKIIGPRVLGGVVSAPTLLLGIEAFADRVRGESSASRVWFTPLGESVQLHLERPFDPGTAGYRQTEWLAMIALIKVVQLFAGQAWQPDLVALRSSQGAPPLARRLFPDVRFLTGQTHSLISFPSELLGAEPQSFGRYETVKLTSSLGVLAPGVPPASLSESLMQILMPYLSDGNPTLEMAAEVVGTSRRTLQRRLAENGLSFSTVVDQTRFRVATKMLKHSDATSLEIAKATGYGDASHFARAFRRLAGCNPHQYRLRNLDHPKFTQPRGLAVPSTLLQHS